MTLMTVPGTTGAGLTPSGALQKNHLLKLDGVDPFSTRPSIAFGDVAGDAGLDDATKEEVLGKSELLVAERAGDELSPVCHVEAPPATTLTDVATVDLGGAVRALVVSSSRGLLRYEASVGAPCGGVFVALSETSAGTDAVAYAASGIVAADFDGDGLEDIGVLGPDGTSFVHQRATSLGDAQ